MARPTKLKVLGSRSIPADIGGQADDRSVIEAFPRQPSPPERSLLDQDVLALLKRSHDRISGEAHQAVAAASAAIEQATAANSATAVLGERAAAIEAQTAAIGETVLSALSDRASTKVASRQAIAAASLGLVERVSERLATLTTFAIDRSPAFLALGASVWLWSNVLSNPSPLQLIALGLFGVVVVAPSIWLSSRRI